MLTTAWQRSARACACRLLFLSCIRYLHHSVCTVQGTPCLSNESTHWADPLVSLQGSIYHRLAAGDNVSLEPACASSDNKQAFSLHALSGDYRRIVVKPQGLTWKLLEYSNPDEPLALSELEKLSGGKEPAALQGVCQCCLTFVLVKL